VFLILAVYANAENHFSSEIPRNFVEAIAQLTEKALIAKQLQQHNVLQSDHYEINSFIRENFIEFTELQYSYAEKSSLLRATDSTAQPNVTQSCLKQLLQFVEALNEKKPWATQVVDAFGKPQSGINWGSLTWAGEYKECTNVTININVTAGDVWQGKYCSVSSSSVVNQITIQFDLSLDKKIIFLYHVKPFKVGLCMPNHCSNIDISQILKFGNIQFP
jgi:hypothetical protein